jgi:hypothetical protein
MTHRSRKLGMLMAIAIAALSLGALGAFHASSAPLTAEPSPTDDHIVPAATTVTGTANVALTTAQCGGHTPPAGTVTCFSIPGNSPVITVFCKNSVAGGKTPAYDPATPGGPGDGDDFKPIKITPLPTFDNGGGAPCTDSLGGSDTSVSNSTHGVWTLTFKDAATDETAAEPGGGDKMIVSVPGAGVIVTNTLGCTITVNPAVNGVFKAFKVTGAYDDHSKYTVAIANLPVTTTGGSCPLPAATTSTFNAIYNFTPGVSDGS